MQSDGDSPNEPAATPRERTGRFRLLRPVVATVLVFLAYRALPSARPANLGPREGRLADCPGTPNCVSSRSGRAPERVEPVPFDGTAEEAVRRVKEALGSLPRTVVVDEGPGYVRAEATSLVFGFVDDIEFLADPDAKAIEVRSASRVGHSDLGVNRARVERFRAAFGRAAGD